MFSRNEKSILSDNYFLIVREEEKFIEIMSKNTGHCWIIYKKSGVAGKPIDLYHKHTKATQYYHKHWQTFSVKSAVNSIKKHDDFVLNKKGV